jgi:DNA polymerase-3 subunit epsilon
MGLISPEAYNARVDRFLQKLNVRGQSFAIIGTGRTPEERSIVWVEDGVYHGYGYFDADTPIEDPFELKGFVEPRSDNLDVQRILNHYLRQNTGQQHGQTGLKPLAEQAGVQVFRAD